MAERLDEVLEEIVRVRADLGHPISATPFSQLMGIQSVLNVVTGERYRVVPDEVIIYVLGHLGTPPAPIDEEAQDRILSSPRGQELLDFEPPQPSLEELRREYGGAQLSDEELLLRYLVPLEDVEATRSAGPLDPGYAFADDLDGFVDHLLALRRPGSIELRARDLQISLHRRAKGR